MGPPASLRVVLVAPIADRAFGDGLVAFAAVLAFAGGARHYCKESTMSIRTSRLSRAAALLVTAAVVLLGAGGAAHADDQATVTTQVVNDTATIQFTNPCTGQTGTITFTYTAVFHQTDRPDGTFNTVANVSGDFVTVLDSGTRQTGHFVEHHVIAGGENLTLSWVLTAQGTASDGSRVSLHFLVVKAENGYGVLVVDLTAC